MKIEQRWRRPRGRWERAAEWKYLSGRDSYRRPSSRGQSRPESCSLALGFLFLVQITTPAFVSAPTFAFTFQSHPIHFFESFASRLSSAACIHPSCLHLNRLFKSKHTHPTVIMVSHCKQDFLHAPKQPLTTARSRIQHISPTLRL